MSDAKKITCPACNGTGTCDGGTCMPSYQCDRCGGSGKIDPPAAAQAPKCPRCGGTGEVADAIGATTACPECAAAG